MYLLGASSFQNGTWLYPQIESRGAYHMNEKKEFVLNDANINKNKISMDSSHLYTFKIGFWLLLLIDSFGFAMFPVWNGISTELMQSRYSLTSQTADYYLLIIYAVPVIISPLYGYILDKKTSSLSYFVTLLIGGIFGMIGHILMMFQFKINMNMFSWLNYVSYNPTISLLFISFGYTLFNAALWPSIPSMISNNDEYKLSTAYGLIYTFYCVSYATSQLIVAIFNEYDYVCAYLIGLSAIYCLIAVILLLWSKDDNYRITQYRSISSSNLLSTPLTNIEEKYEEQICDEEGDHDTMMGAIDRTRSRLSLWSDSNNDEKDDDDEDDGNDEHGVHNTTLMGFAGENEKIIMNKTNHDYNSALSVITDDDKYGLL